MFACGGAFLRHTKPYFEDGDRKFLRNVDIYQFTRCHMSEGAVSHNVVPLEFMQCIISHDCLRIVYYVGPTVAIWHVEAV
jgi:hypothetical protein